MIKLGKHILLALAVACASFAGAKTPPNIVLILSDDQGYADYSFMGHDLIETPRLDQLAKESLVFKRGYVTTAICCPSISTMLTGLYPHEHGTTSNDPVGRGVSRKPWNDLFQSMPQLPRMLQEKGYLSLQTGKYWHGQPEKISGFTHSMGPTGRHGSEYSLSIGRDTMEPIYDFINEAQEQEKPFLVWYAPFLPHTPHNPPKRLEDKYIAKGATQQAKYYAMCEWFDESCGQLLDFLDEKELSDNTLVFYICDNGWGTLEGRRGSVKCSPYELATRTPVMIRWPGKLKPKMDEDNFASNLDLVPTVLDAAGLKATPEMSGISLLNKPAVKKRDRLFFENYTHDMLAVDDPAAGLRARSVILDDWKLTLWRTPHESLKLQGWQMPPPETPVELFNIQNDPLEADNLAEQHPEKVAALEKLIDGWWNPDGN